MKYFVVSLLLLLVVGLVGCNYVAGTSSEAEPIVVGNEPIVAVEDEPIIVVMEGTITAIPATYEVSDKGAVGFEPGKYTIGNYASGKEADLPIVLHSDRVEPITMQLSYRVPSYTREGYIIAPDLVKNWLSFDNPTPVLKAQERKEVIATLSVPYGVELPDNWEFWIAIRETNQASQVQVEGCIRVFVNMGS